MLPCLQLRRCDVVGVEKAVFDRWVAAGEPVKAIMESKPVPGLSVAVKQGAYLRSYIYTFIELLAPTLNRKMVEAAMRGGDNYEL